MTVSELIDRILAAYAGASPEAMATFKPVFYARFSKREGPHLQAAFEAVLAEFKPTMRQPFPIPANIEAHMPGSGLDYGTGDGHKLDLDGRKRRADSLFANWLAGQGTRAAKGNEMLRRALENVARPVADVMGWNENPEPLVLTRDQLKTACQRAISQERRLRYGQIPKDRFVWWQQITDVAASWSIEVTPHWWDETTGKALTQPDVEAEQQEPKRPTGAPAKPISAEQRAALDAALAQRHRAQGRTAYADTLEQRAALAGFPPVVDEPPAHDDVPEAMEVGT